MVTNAHAGRGDTRVAGAMQRQQFIAEASRVLAESIDYEATLQSVARLAVPAIADWCVIDLVRDDGSLTRVAIEHKDRDRRQLAAALKDRYPAILEASYGPARVLETCRTDYEEHVPHCFIEAAGVPPDRLRLLRRLGLHAYICAPLIARGRVLGTITLFTGQDRAFGPDDLAMAEELARWSAMAIDNARLHDEAQRAVQSRDEMLALISHDLWTPLSAILMAAEIQIASAPRSEEGRRLREGAETSRRAAQHMCRLISDLTDMSQIEVGSLAIQRNYHAPEDIVGDAMRTLRPIAEEQGAFLTCELSGPPAKVGCDRDRVVQVLSNLATDAMNAGAVSITIRAKSRRQRVRFTVEDTGPGLPAEDIAHIFDRYWRGRHAKYRGLGLGLPIAKGIIDAHGGDLSVSSRVGVGTVFSFWLPATARAVCAVDGGHEAGACAADAR